MAFRQRLERLERLVRSQPTPARLTNEERARGIAALLAYGGTDPAALARQQRLVQLLQIFRARRAAAEKRRAARQRTGMGEPAIARMQR